MDGTANPHLSTVPRARRPLALSLMVALAMILGLAPQAVFAPQAVAAVCTGGTLNISAHTDDDLLFISPDLLNDLSAGRCVRTLYVSAGDADLDPDYWAQRERGIEAAYASMAGVPNTWTTSTLTAASKSLRLRTLTGVGVSLVYMRLPDGFPLGSGSATYGYQSIKKLLDGSISTITAVDGSNSYTSTSLRNAMLDVMRASNATSVRTLDYVHSYGFTGGGWTDHYDHLASAYVASDASDAYAAAHRLTGYMGYPVTGQAVNVSGTSLTRKTAAFQTYADYDWSAVVPDYAARGWLNHQVTVATSGPTVIAFAGDDQVVNAGFPVTLDATGSTATGTLAYAWTQTGGTAVALSSTTSSRPTFVPATSGSYAFQVRVTSGSSSATDTVNVSVNSSTSGNVARLAGVGVTASSAATAQPAARVVDGVASGYPADYTKEWATVGGGVGSWVKLTWPQPVHVDRVVLFDRPNTDDQVQGGVLTFSDGSTVDVGALDNAGGATSVAFSPRVTSSIQFTVRQVAATTANVGLAEFEVYGALDKAPTVNAGVDQNVATGTLVTLEGSGTDPDAGAVLTYAWSQTSGPVTVTLSNPAVAKPTFTPTVVGAYSFSLTASDGGLTSPADSVSVTVSLPNHPPTANAGPDQTVAAGAVVTLVALASDPDPDSVLGYGWTQASGPPVTLSNPAAEQPTFTATVPGSYVFTLTISDGVLNATDTVTITVSAANQAPTANAGADRSVATGTTVTLAGSATDPDAGTTLSYAWTQTSGPATVTLSDPAVAQPTFTPTVLGSYVFTLTASDGALNATDTVTITVTPPNRAPSANAGADQAVATDAVVTLDGSGTDPDAGAVLSYAWTQTSGPAPMALSDAAAAKPTFTAATAGTYVFTLTVSDGALNATDTVTVTVTTPNRAPTANAGADQFALPTAVVTLAGGGTDPDPGTVLTYAWEQTSGPVPTALSNAAAAQPTFTQPVTGTYVFTLTVSDGSLSATDSVTVTVTLTPPVNQAPTANAGPDQAVVSGTLVTLAGSGSDPDPGTTLTYSWTRESGPANVSLSDPAVAQPTFTPTTANTYVFTLTVSDGSLSATDTVTITVSKANSAPSANAGPDQAVATGALVTLAGSGTDPDAGTTLGYSWVRTSGPAPVTLSDPAVAGPTFTPATPGTYVFTLTVTDGSLSATDTVTITVTTPNSAPSANAGPDQAVATGALVTLAGSGTDPDAGTTLGYSWARTSGPAPVTLSDPAVAGPTFTPATPGTYVFTLTVTDGSLSATDTVTITVTTPILPPTANAGPDLSTVPTTTVTLDGSGSTNPNATPPLTFAWTQTSGPAVPLSDPANAKPTFTPAAVGTYVFQLTVTVATLSSTDSVTVVVTSAQEVNLARASGVTVTASSQNTTTTQTAAKAVDGSPTGYPTDYTKEWSTVGGKAGSWLQLTWATPVTLSRVVLYDRPNTSDQITAGTLLFSDGTTAPVTSLTNAGTATTITFTPRTVTSVRLQITTVSSTTANVGLAEIEAWGYTGGSAVNRAPVASAGADQSVTAGTQVTLDGSASSDPDPGTTLTYAWSKTSGPAATLSNAGAARPTFTPAAAGTYVFALVVSDGVLSAGDSVSVTVAPAPNRAPTALADNQSAVVNTLVTLDGSRSSDPEGGALTYAWTPKSGPAVTLANAATVRPTFTPVATGAYVFTLTVTDTGGLTSAVDVTVTVSAVAPTVINVARASGVTVTASSENTATTQTAAKAVDGSPTGYPTDYTKEWSTVGGKAGSWLQLTWATPVTLSRVVLYDRPNTSDQITAGTLLFSDGTTAPVTSLTNAGTATTITFTPRTVTSVRLQITTVSSTTANVGLAEIEAWGYSAS